jgi:hypothetical protein
LQRYYPALSRLYESIAVAIPGDVNDEVVGGLRSLPNLRYIHAGFLSARHSVVELALEADTEHIHYIDMDRLIRWVETRPDELESAVERMQTVGTLIMGRTENAYNTHPQALHQTEALANAALSHWFGAAMDFCAGSRGLSRSAAAYVLARSPRDMALRMDAEWAVLLKRGGFKVGYIEADGLDWESADQYQDRAANRERQRRLADEYDQQAEHWALRVQVAQDILQAGLEATRCDLEAVFDSVGNDPPHV